MDINEYKIIKTSHNEYSICFLISVPTVVTEGVVVLEIDGRIKFKKIW